MQVKSVQIRVTMEDDEVHALWLTFRELSAMVGALNIVADLHEVEEMSIKGTQEVTHRVMTHLDNFAQEVDEPLIYTLIWRLAEFATDKLMGETND